MIIHFYSFLFIFRQVFTLIRVEKNQMFSIYLSILTFGVLVQKAKVFLVRWNVKLGTLR